MRRVYRYRFYILVTLAVTLLLLRSGLMSPLFQSSTWLEESYREIKPGMQPDEVEAILGRPDAADQSTSKAWIRGSGAVIVTFKDDRVISKQYRSFAPSSPIPRR